jgi:hypothetical protein
LPFLPLWRMCIRGEMARGGNSSLVARIGNVTLRVMGGKSGKMWQGDVAVLGEDVAVLGEDVAAAVARGR